ncbi:hypothetical protein AVCANL277_01110 [Campylobacter canadensis]|uniref:hypothetical protein n=1 Tax=Campylobacter canadensis TaxID=449520 RepID=UPI001CC9AFE8|nr:hypothetical protein [Campylobacter canadensis]MBZ7999466.1 hypothetical protein [Campylobacter canadensis]MBZ8001263.1 hypothetical protein [Campylobacter canadensis]
MRDFLRSFLSTTYIIIAIKEASYVVYAYEFKNKKQKRKFFKEFNKDDIKNLKDYLNTLINMNYFAYVSLFFSSIGQGVLSSVSKNNLSKFGIDSSSVYLKNLQDCYLYVAISELQKSNCILDDLQIDLIYSPFVILLKLLKDRNIFNTNQACLNILRYEAFICVIISKDSKILFGGYFELKNQVIDIQNDNIIDDSMMVEDSIDLEIDFDQLEKVDEQLQIQLEEDNNSSSDNVKLDLSVLDYVKSAVQEFYTNNAYNGEFITQINLFEQDKISKSLISLMEDDLMIKINSYNINIFEQILYMSIMDLGIKYDL